MPSSKRFKAPRQVEIPRRLSSPELEESKLAEPEPRNWFRSRRIEESPDLLRFAGGFSFRTKRVETRRSRAKKVGADLEESKFRIVEVRRKSQVKQASRSTNFNMVAIPQNAI